MQPIELLTACRAGPARLALSSVLLFILVGCRKQPEIERYQVAKPSVVARQNGPPDDLLDFVGIEEKDRMLAAVLADPPQAWFFKITGPIEEVAKVETAFEQFLASVGLDKEGKPEWKLPEGWSEEKSQQQMRFATLKIPTGGGSTIDMSVIPLPLQRGLSKQDFLVANVNRWRRQMKLPGVTEAYLDIYTRKIQPGKYELVVVDLKGEMDSSSSSAPFASSMAGRSAPAVSPPATTSRPSGKVDYEKPEGWLPGRMNSFRLAAFQVERGDQSVEITVSTAGGSLLANVNRWRDQTGLGSVDAATLAKQAQKVPFENGTAPMYEIHGPKGTIVGVVAERGSSSVFVKMTGDEDLAKKELPRFVKFVGSLKFN